MGQQEDPWLHAISLNIEARLATSRFLYDLINTDVDDVGAAILQVKQEGGK